MQLHQLENSQHWSPQRKYIIVRTHGTKSIILWYVPLPPPRSMHDTTHTSPILFSKGDFPCIYLNFAWKHTYFRYKQAWNPGFLPIARHFWVMFAFGIWDSPKDRFKIWVASGVHKFWYIIPYQCIEAKR